MVWHSMDDAKNDERTYVQLEELEEKEKMKGMKYGVPLALIWVVWGERNRKSF